mgnify:FL=1
MKRIVIRVSILATVVTVGFLTIAQAQRAFRQPDPPANAPANVANEASLEPIATEAPPATEVAPAATRVDEAATLRVEPVAYEAEAIRPPAATTGEVAPATAPNPFRSESVPANDSFPTAEEALAGAGDAQEYLPGTMAAAEQPPVGAPQASAHAPEGSQPQSADGSVPPASFPGEPIPASQPAGFESPPPASNGFPAPGELPVAAPAEMMPTPAGLPAANDFPPAATALAPTQPAVGTPVSPLGDAGLIETGEGTGVPGPEEIEGAQIPAVSVEKIAPAEVQVGKPAVFEIVVSNSGQIAVEEVELRDEVPRGAQLLGTEPRASRGAGGELIWALATLQPGEERRVSVELLPIAEGEIGSVALVSFAAAASARTVATRPRLVLAVSGPDAAHVKDEVTLNIDVTNVGTGTATGVFLASNLPPTISHAAGSALEYEIGSLAPEESHQLQLTVGAAQAGLVQQVITAQGEGDVQAEAVWEAEIVAPALEVAIDGPRRRYLEKEARYTVSVNNPGTAAARDVELVAYLPAGLEFVEADNYGEYDPETGGVYWLLEELPAGQGGNVTVRALAVDAGAQALRVEGKSAEGLSHASSHEVLIEGVAAIHFQVADVEDPVETGGETTYEIRVVNQGSKGATNVQLAALVPPQMQLLAAEGPTRHNVEGAAGQQRVVFEPLPQLAPRADTTYRVRVQAVQPGDSRLRVQLMTDDMQEPVTKEESTRIYASE